MGFAERTTVCGSTAQLPPGAVGTYVAPSLAPGQVDALQIQERRPSIAAKSAIERFDRAPGGGVARGGAFTCEAELASPLVPDDHRLREDDLEATRRTAKRDLEPRLRSPRRNHPKDLAAGERPAHPLPAAASDGPVPRTEPI